MLAKVHIHWASITFKKKMRYVMKRMRYMMKEKTKLIINVT
jgi:hypothetical protein